MLVQFAQIQQAQAPDIQRAHGGLPNRETCDSEVMRTFSIAVQEARGNQIGQKAVDRAYGQPRQSCHLLGKAAPWAIR